MMAWLASSLDRSPDGASVRCAASRVRADAVAWAGLALATLAACWPLGLTNRILAGVDAFTYFTPYWAYRMAALRAGSIPLWNPYLFLGVPFLANPQAAVLYPLHWPLSWLDPAQALIWSALLHVWLAAGSAYTLGRRSFGLTRPAAWMAGTMFGLGGFTLARIENINQLNTLAWLPALLWLYDETAKSEGWRTRVRWGAGLAIVIALQLLAGHTQTFFVNLVGLALYAGWPLVRDIARRLLRRGDPAVPLGRHLAPFLALVPALLLAAAQLLPMLELQQLGLRTGGLPYRQAVSFSLKPHLLAQSLLPPLGGGLGQAFGSEGYAEFVGYVGVAGIALAIAGAWTVRRRRDGTARAGSALLLVAAGLFLALGAYNPVYYLLWRFIPGFDLFRAPARWLALYALGMAMLAGIGLDGLRRAASDRLVTRRGRFATRIALLLGLLAVLALAAIQQRPPPRALAGWAACAAAAGALLWAGRRRPRPARLGLIALLLAELWLASRALPLSEATAPMALSLRNAPAALLAAGRDRPSPGRDRFLSLSDIRYDPGDLAELRSLQADRLPAAAVARLVRAAKQMEVIAPNLPLLLQLPAADGYDGGVLPLDFYVKLQRLFLPPESLLPDGRLAEQLQQVPEDRLLDLIGVRYLITDKQRDRWVDDVYYDLELAARLEPGAALVLDLAGYPEFSASALGVVAEVDGAIPDGSIAAEVLVQTAEGRPQALVLHAGSTTRGTLAPARLALPKPLTPTIITVRVPADATGAVILRGLSLIDGRTGAHTSVTISGHGDVRRIHSGDVKVYARTGATGRAWLVHGVEPVADEAEALARLADPGFDPRATAVVAAPVPAAPPAAAGRGESVTLDTAEPERLALTAEVSAPALLVLADTLYPGWQATVDGLPAPILPANVMFRGVALGPGRHQVVFSYRPTSWRCGMGVSASALILLVIVLAATSARRVRKG